MQVNTALLARTFLVGTGLTLADLMVFAVLQPTCVRPGHLTITQHATRENSQPIPVATTPTPLARVQAQARVSEARNVCGHPCSTSWPPRSWCICAI